MAKELVRDACNKIYNQMIVLIRDDFKETMDHERKIPETYEYEEVVVSTLMQTDLEESDKKITNIKEEVEMIMEK